MLDRALLSLPLQSVAVKRGSARALYVVRRLSLAIISVLALVGILLSALQMMIYLERPRSNFVDLAEAKDAGMISRGWLPSYLPQSTKNIQEGHNVDTNEVWAVFDYDPQDAHSIENACKLIAHTADGRKFICPPYEERTSSVVLRANGTGSYASRQDDI